MVILRADRMVNVIEADLRRLARVIMVEILIREATAVRK
jgi:hypothetical protein